MNRNLIKYAKEGNKRIKADHRLDLTMAEVDSLINVFREQIRNTDDILDGLLEVIRLSYYAGLETGMRKKG